MHWQGPCSHVSRSSALFISLLLFIYRQCQFEEVEVCTLPNNPKNVDWDAAAKHLTASLDKFKVPEKEKGEILAFVTTLKNDIVDK